jgi:hypothetical protein
MARKDREDYRLKDTEKVRDAVKRNNTQVKDYSLKYLISVEWKINKVYTDRHLIKLSIGNAEFMGMGTNVSRAIQDIVAGQNEYDWLPRERVAVPSFQGVTPPLIIYTTDVNKECLRDHVARFTIGKCTSLIDVEEMLKAIRYA